jgi:hypothetical protein
VTNRYNRIHRGLNSRNHESPCHITFTALQGNFYIGNWSNDKRCPGIPLDPEILKEREKFHVDWVEIEFKNDTGKSHFSHLIEGNWET